MSRPKISFKALVVSIGVGFILSLLVTILAKNSVGVTSLAACGLAGLLYPLVGFLYGALTRRLQASIISTFGGGAIAATLVLACQFLSAVLMSPTAPLPAIMEGITSAISLTGYSSSLVIGAMIAGFCIACCAVAISGAVGAFLATLINRGEKRADETTA